MLAILEKVRLKRENYVALMQHVKVFVEKRAPTQKKGYKILTRVIERFELSSLDEIVEIKQAITPLMTGQATKERISLISGFITAVQNIVTAATAEGQATPESLAPQTLTFMQPFVTELITAMNNSN